MIRQSFLVVVFCCLAGSWLMAQHGPHRGHPKGPKPEMTEEMKTALNLSTEQRTQLNELRTETETAVQAIFQQQELTWEARRAELRKQQETGKAKFEEILTIKQLAQLRGLRKAEKARRQELMSQVDRKALREEMRSYKTRQIAPVMRAQRQQLETQLSEEDQVELAAIRSQIKPEPEEGISKRPGRGPRGEAGEGRHKKHRRGHPAMHRRTKSQRLQARFPEQYQSLVTLVNKYDQQIGALMSDMEPQREQWKIDQTAIRVKYLPAELLENKRERIRPALGGEERAAAQDMSSKIYFLLHDPANAKD